MTIHVVQSGETINSISEKYKIPVARLILDNGIENPDKLAIGQTIVIIQPEITYTVQTGDTIVIKYQTNKTRAIATSGYIFPYINRSVLIKTLPFLSYLTIFNYRATGEGEIITSADDTELVQLVISYGVAPMMFVSTITEEGVADREINYIILNNPSVQKKLVESSLQILKNKGYYGINLYIENINYDNIDKIADYLKKISEIYHSEGYRIVITITPVTSIDTTGINFDKLDYYRLAQYVDGIIFASYEWARTFSFPSSIFPVNLILELLDYAVDNIPHEKIYLGVTTVGYDWTLPYIPGATGANIITNNSAIQFAANTNTPIKFNVPAQSPYFYYKDRDGILHVVWFKDARSYEARAVLVDEYNLKGLSLWTIMIFDHQMWLIINNQYEIEKPMLVN